MYICVYAYMYVCMLVKKSISHLVWLGADKTQSLLTINTCASFAYSHHPYLTSCVYVCVYLCVLHVYVNVCSWVAKILEKIIIKHFQSGSANPLFSSDLDIQFEGQSFGIYYICEYLVNGDRKSKQYYFHQL